MLDATGLSRGVRYSSVLKEQPGTLWSLWQCYIRKQLFGFLIFFEHLDINSNPSSTPCGGRRWSEGDFSFSKDGSTQQKVPTYVLVSSPSSLYLGYQNILPQSFQNTGEFSRSLFQNFSSPFIFSALIHRYFFVLRQF